MVFGYSRDRVILPDFSLDIPAGQTIALVGAKRGKLAEIATHTIVIDSDHYGRVEDAHMTICHLLAYAFMELPDITQES